MSKFLSRSFKKNRFILTALIIFIFLTCLLFIIPPIRDRISARWDDWVARAFLIIAPPNKSVFVPQNQIATIVQKTMGAIYPTATSPINNTPTVSLTATQTTLPTPLPGYVLLGQVPYIDQNYGMNNCAPANLAMQLGFWGWNGKREDISRGVKPFDQDKNVMPYELADYVNSTTKLKAIVRVGGTEDLVKNLISNGFPVLIEKGDDLEYPPGVVSWMGHYNIIIGYDETRQEFITHDSFLIDGKFKHFGYDFIKQQWRAFNYTFLIVYPPDKWDLLARLLGPYADEEQSYSLAEKISDKDVEGTNGRDHFFALFNKGTNLVNKKDYPAAAAAFDQAYQYYPTLPEENRPYRMTWYQIGPYMAYYYTSRFQDLINLTTTTLGTTAQPYMEESYYWRALAEIKTDQPDRAAQDVCSALKYHPGMPVYLQEIKDMGATCSN